MPDTARKQFQAILVWLKSGNLTQENKSKTLTLIRDVCSASMSLSLERFRRFLEGSDHLFMNSECFTQEQMGALVDEQGQPDPRAISLLIQADQGQSLRVPHEI